jgi:hypothetical protein
MRERAGPTLSRDEAYFVQRKGDSAPFKHANWLSQALENGATAVAQAILGAVQKEEMKS